MYFPYFRGRQYELLALKELAQNKLISNKVVPVVEPVKQIPGLKNTLLAFKSASLSLGIIQNPNVGSLVGQWRTVMHLMDDFLGQSQIIPSVLLNEDAETVLTELENRSISRDKVLTILQKYDDISFYQGLFSSSPQYTLSPFERNIRRAVRKNMVLFEDHFNKKNRNAAYPEDEAFSNDHLDYDLDGYVGFGDYSMIGEEYNESGFAPYAVAIHIVYFDNDNSLRIKHFISDSNDDISDVAGKFYEAVTKLYAWYTEEHQERQLTRGLKVLLDHYTNKTYPGLPTLKKLSIMHHLELMSRYLEMGD